MSFKAIVVSESLDGKFTREIADRELEDLPQGDVLIRVNYSSLNYKDALSANGNKGITKSYPHTPGIDAAGIVEISRHESVSVGEQVIVTGFDLGMNTPGGFAEFVRVPASWIMNKPENYTLKESMIFGTAGFTAAAALYKMSLMGLDPSAGPIVVTGSTGGVGSIAVALLAKAGYEVIAVTGKENSHEYLEFLGAKQVAGRDFVDDKSLKQLLAPRWAGAIDTVGGNTLSTLLRSCQPEGCVVSTGLVGSATLNTTVFPFILNGVSLLGIGSAEMPMETRKLIWKKLDTDWSIQNKLSTIGKEVSLETLNESCINAILEGSITGRIVVAMKDK